MSIALRIVQVAGGKYGIQKREGDWFNKWEYVDPSSAFEWTKPEFIIKYCFVETLKEAEDAMTKQLSRYSKPKDIKLPRITRVIRKVKV
jgi:hypothetical protein